MLVTHSHPFHCEFNNSLYKILEKKGKMKMERKKNMKEREHFIDTQLHTRGENTQTFV